MSRPSTASPPIITGWATVCNCVTVDYDQDGKYWAFYVDGEYAATGVDSTDITAGATYTFKAE